MSNKEYSKNTNLSLGLNFKVSNKESNEAENKQKNDPNFSGLRSTTISSQRDLSYALSKTMATLGKGNIKVTNTNTLGFGIISSGANVTNKGDITLEDTLNQDKANIGMYTAGSDSLKNMGKITVGKNGIGIYGKDITNGDSVTLPNSTILRAEESTSDMYTSIDIVLDNLERQIRKNKTKLQKKYGDLEVLKSIDLSIEEGEVVCIIGPSGSGKSTFLRCLNRLEKINSGHIIIDGYDLTDKKTNLNK